MKITIDGPAGSGKSTLAELVSEDLHFIHFNSGSLYRGITAHLDNIGFDFSQIGENEPVFNLNLKVEFIDDVQHVFVNGTDYTKFLRNNMISTLSPLITRNKSLRNIIDNCQKEFCNQHNVVMEGRDLGSFVFPDAEIKFYLDCSVEERARRRRLEELEKGNNISMEEMIDQIAERDRIDKTRKIAPLVVPKDAIIIDSSHLSIEEVLSIMLDHIEKEREKLL